MTSTAPAPQARRTADLVWSAALLLVPLVAAFPAFVLMGILWFAAQGRDSWWLMRSWTELLIWQLPLGLWLATLVAVIVLAARRRRALPAALVGVCVIAASMVTGLVVAALAAA